LIPEAAFFFLFSGELAQRGGDELGRQSDKAAPFFPEDVFHQQVRMLMVSLQNDGLNSSIDSLKQKIFVLSLQYLGYQSQVELLIEVGAEDQRLRSILNLRYVDVSGKLHKQKLLRKRKKAVCLGSVHFIVEV
jgi:hypothetical protein